MDAGEFERDLSAWIDGELPPERAAAMQAAVDASPLLAERAALERAFDGRMKKALRSDPGSVETVRRMAAKARADTIPAGRMSKFPRRALRIAASFLVVALGGMWWFCIPPFECSYMQALEKAAEDHAAVPGAAAEQLAKRSPMPAEIDGYLAAPPAALAKLDFFAWHLDGVRLDYVRADGAALHTIVCPESAAVQPSWRRRVTRDGADWWIADVDGRRVVAFRTSDGATVAAVTGPAGDESVYAAAKALRASLR